MSEDKPVVRIIDRRGEKEDPPMHKAIQAALESQPSPPVQAPPDQRQPKHVSEYRVALLFQCGNAACNETGSIDDPRAISQALMSGGQFRFGIDCKKCGELTLFTFKQDVIVVPGQQAPMNRAQRRAMGKHP